MVKHYGDGIEEVLVDALNKVVEIFDDNDVCTDCGFAELVVAILSEMMHADKKVTSDVDAAMWLAAISKRVFVEWKDTANLDERNPHAVH